MLADVLDVLRCPVCTGSFRKEGAALRCGAGHTFDVARQGYVNLLGSAGPRTADTGPMVQARADFLAGRHYAPLAGAVTAAVADLIPDDPSPVVLDVGGGTGYYLKAAIDARPGAIGIALDLSKFAVRRTARAHPRIAAAVWDVWQPLPIADAAVSVILDVFAPRNAAEFARVLDPAGAALVVTPTDRHLAELVDRIGMLTVDTHKEERLGRRLGGHLKLIGRDELTWSLTLSGTDVERLVRMGPSARHVSDATLTERIAGLEGSVTVTASVLISRYGRAE